MIDNLAELADEQHAYVTTTGRVSGEPHEIEIWFATNGTSIHLISGGGDRSDWVRNLLHDPAAAVRVSDRSGTFTARFDLTADERRSAALELARKYRPGRADDWVDGYLIALDPNPHTRTETS